MADVSGRGVYNFHVTMRNNKCLPELKREPRSRSFATSIILFGILVRKKTTIYGQFVRFRVAMREQGLKGV